MTKKVQTRLTEDEVDKVFENVPQEMREENYLEVGIRPWGVYYVLEDKDQYKVKKIVVNPGHRLSLQRHQHRSEHWVTVSGMATVEVHSGEDQNKWKYTVPPNESCFIPMGCQHRLANFGKIPLVIIEIQVGEYTGEDDIERFEDDYSRI